MARKPGETSIDEIERYAEYDRADRELKEKTDQFIKKTSRLYFMVFPHWALIENMINMEIINNPELNPDLLRNAIKEYLDQHPGVGQYGHSRL